MTVGTPQVAADFPSTTGGVGSTTDDCPAGSLIVVIPYPDTLNGTVTGVSDSVGNTYVKAIATATTSGQFTCSIWYCSNCAHVPVGSTIHVSGSPTSIDFTAYYVANANGGLDVTNSTVKGTASTSLSLTSGTLAQADEIVFAACFPANAPASPTASGWTCYDGAYAYYKNPGVTTSQTFAPSWSGSAKATAVLAAFKGPSNAAQHVTLSVALLAFSGAALPVNAKSQRAFSAAALGFGGHAAAVNAKQQTAMAPAALAFDGTALDVSTPVALQITPSALTLSGHAIAVNAKSMLQFATAAVAFTGSALQSGATQAVVVTGTALAFGGQALAVNARTAVTLAAAALVFTAQAVGIAGVISVEIAAAVLAFGGRALNRVMAGLTSLLHTLGVGQ